MSKKGNNKRIKQMIFDVAMQGRKLFWYGEESEIFLAYSAEAIKNEYDDPNNDEDEQCCEQVKTNWRVMWSAVRCEEPIGGAKLIKGSDFHYAVPLISFVTPYSEYYPVDCMSTSYN